MDIWNGVEVWADAVEYEGNRVCQLLVPAAPLFLADADEALTVGNSYGRWPAYSPAAVPGEHLALRLPPEARPGEPISAGQWTGPRTQQGNEDVLATYPGAMSFNQATDGPGPGLRRPQLGAVHAVLGEWTTGRTSAVTVVMPTGTGKTETMLALLVAARPRRLLVMVPSIALREQVAGKFERLGVLQQLGIVSPKASRPSVGRLEHGFQDADSARMFAESCNVIVATTAALHSCHDVARASLLAGCSHLFVDEAHHVPARTWTDIADAFVGRPIVQFTATPFREDGKHIAGRLIYQFPLREAQAEGYFAVINYTSIIEFEDLDRAVATQALARLRADIDAGYDHLMMVRTSGIPRAHELLPLYEELASDLHPVILNSQLSQSRQKEALTAIRSGQSRIIVCVNMLGEGFDLPTLKVAAVHDPQRSLGVTLQFIGRFARSGDVATLGEASMFVARKEMEVDRRLRALYSEDSDWNLVLRNLSETAVEEQQEVSEFEAGFTSLPEEVTLRNLLPKMSTVVYRAPSTDWQPDAVYDFFGEENLFTVPIGLNLSAGVAWCVVEHRDAVRWGNLRTIEERSYELFVLYFDQARRLLYINSSANSGLFPELATAVVGAGAERFTGSTVYRVMGDIKRLVPTTVGVVDIVSHFRRFSMHVGSDVSEGFSTSEAQTKTQTNISAWGYRDGERVNISASRKGRIWSHAAAQTLKHWCDWCDQVGTRLIDDTISIADVISNFLLPRTINARPSAVLLALEWPWEVYALETDAVLSHSGRRYALVDVELRSNDTNTTGPFRFEVVTQEWSVSYQADYTNGQLIYSVSAGTEVELEGARGSQPLSAWLNAKGLTLLLDGDRMIDDDGLLYEVDREREPFNRAALIPFDWSDTDIHVESQGSERRQDSIQARMIRELSAEGRWELILDDDGKNEVADIVAMRVAEDGFRVRLVHCKYAGGDVGARLEDLYELCGQAQKSVAWRRGELMTMFRHLERRARNRMARTKVSPFEVGDLRSMYELHERALQLKHHFELDIVQPGLSVAKATTRQLDVLSATETYVLQTAAARLRVICSS